MTGLPSGAPRYTTIFAVTLFAIEFLDEFVFGIREAAWPLIRTDLDLDYAQIGLLLGLPNVASALVEPVIGVLGDVWRRRLLVLGGGALFVLGLSAHSVEHGLPRPAHRLYSPLAGLGRVCHALPGDANGHRPHRPRAE